MFKNRSNIYIFFKIRILHVYFKIKEKLIIKSPKKTLFHEGTDDSVETVQMKKFTLNKTYINIFIVNI